MSKRILVVEDQPDNRQIIRDMLAPTDYEITEAENGEEALAAIASQRPDLILMDIQLPIMDGYEATRRIKADASLRSIPIIAVTSYALSGEGQKARVAGCDDYVPKPTARANCWRKFGSTCPNKSRSIGRTARSHRKWITPNPPGFAKLYAPALPMRGLRRQDAQRLRLRRSLASRYAPCDRSSTLTIFIAIPRLVIARSASSKGEQNLPTGLP